jgi:oligopeptide/dipeptide ABC transporter ATP-binding protein
MVFQEPAASLNPVRPVGKQIEAVLALGAGLDRSARPARVHELLEQVGITDPSRRARSYPHELSGGMAQRVMIALALAKEPSLLIADEPTTALDVTVQDEILSLLRRLSADLDLAVLLVTHDLGVVADLADRAAVMYAGRIVEEGNVESLLVDPLHPYTSALAAAVPRNQPRSGDLQGLAGSVPLPGEWPDGCTFADRCAYRVDRCDQTEPSLDGIEHAVRCHLAQDLELAGIRAEVGRD